MFFVTFYRLNFKKNRKYYRGIYNLIGYCPSNYILFKQALRHSSSTNKASQFVDNNERLEYLGDAVLDLVVADVLFKIFPYKEEGFLTEMRSKMVSRSQLSNLAYKMGLLSLMEYNPDLNKTPRILSTVACNALEAVIGAVYIDKGYKGAKKFIEKRIIGEHINFEELSLQEISYKGKLYKWAQHNKKTLEFRLTNETRQKNQKYFEITLYLNDENMGKEVHFSKRQCEEQLSEKVLNKLYEREKKTVE